MKEKDFDYSQFYDSNYYHSHLGEVPYENKDFWGHGFKKIAKDIIKEFNPKIVLDVGCAFGYLVAELRNMGVEAYGIDVSDYAISQVPKDIKKYCAVKSALDKLPEEFPKKYDLVITIEVIEHLYPEDGDIFIKNICSYSDNVIFSSSPDDKAEVTHFNVQPSIYWTKRFFKNGFYNDYNRKPYYISPQCLFFRKISNTEEIIEKYENAFNKINIKHKEELRIICDDRKKAQEVMDTQAQQIKSLLNDMDILREDRRKAQEVMDNESYQIKSMNRELERLKAENTRMNDTIIKQNNKIEELSKKYEEIIQSFIWKIIKPIWNKCSKAKGKR